MIWDLGCPDFPAPTPQPRSALAWAAAISLAIGIWVSVFRSLTTSIFSVSASDTISHYNLKTLQMNAKYYIIPVLLTIVLFISLSSCSKDPDDVPALGTAGMSMKVDG